MLKPRHQSVIYEEVVIKLNTFRRIVSLVIFTGSLTATPAFAQSGDPWEYSAAVNLWAAGIEGTTGARYLDLKTLVANIRLLYRANGQ